MRYEKSTSVSEAVKKKEKNVKHDCWRGRERESDPSEIKTNLNHRPKPPDFFSSFGKSLNQKMMRVVYLQIELEDSAVHGVELDGVAPENVFPENSP